MGKSQKTTCFGTLNPARVSLQKLINSFSVTGLSLTISIKAQGTSPHFSSGLATTAAIDTEGCFAKVFSISIEDIFSPPEIMIKGNIVMKGYFKDKDATSKAMNGGWFHSGDLAVMHPDGYVKIQDRSKDIIISGGENISSIEIENTLAKHPSVSIAAVVAKPDDKWGEVPCAFIEMVKDKPVTEKELISFCKETLAGFKVPKQVVFCDLPKTSTGKIQKFELRKKF